MHVTAIVPAAGSGARFGAAVPKQYLPLAGCPILVWTLRALAASGRIDCVLVVTPPGQEERCRNDILRPHGLTVDGLLPGGADRQASVYAGLLAAPADTDLILVHDGARPLVTPEIVEAALKAARDDSFVAETLPRGRLWAAQTPQVFRAVWLREGHERALRDGYRGTDDSVLVERLGYPVRLVPGSAENLKVTTLADLVQAEQILRGRMTNDK
jgi:2-C-methyl-D-erythritol 4-phosphate cytidylyltransferase